MEYIKVNHVLKRIIFHKKQNVKEKSMIKIEMKKVTGDFRYKCTYWFILNQILNMENAMRLLNYSEEIWQTYEINNAS